MWLNLLLLGEYPIGMQVVTEEVATLEIVVAWRTRSTAKEALGRIVGTRRIILPLGRLGLLLVVLHDGVRIWVFTSDRSETIPQFLKIETL